MADTDLLVVSRGGVQYKITRGELDAYLKDGYTVVDSMLFNGTNAYLGRTPAVAGNRQTFTWSGWVKRGKLGTNQCLFGTGTESSRFDQITLSDDDTLDFITYPAGVTSRKKTTQVLRDPSAWYHIVCVYDTTNVTADDRMRIYINGERVTDFSSSTNPSLNYSSPYFNAARFTTIGRLVPATGYTNWFNGYLSEVNFIDGQALEPSAFGETGKFGEWLPKKYTGTYGTNGFYLEALDSADLGKDTSGNGNDWANTNAVQVIDTPTDNYAVINPLIANPSLTYSNGNLKVNGTAGGWMGAPATIYVDSGKWYWETTITAVGTYSQVGIAEESYDSKSSLGLQSNAYGYYSFNGNALRDGTSTAYGATYTTGDVIGITLDYDNGEITYYKNGVSQGVAFTGVTEKLTPASALFGSATHNFNAGQLPFAYAVPTGFKALSTQNLPDATVVPSESFDVILDDGATIKDTAEAVYPTQLSWIKALGVNNHQLIDSVRGLDSVLQSDTASASTTYVTPVGNSVAWNWKAGTEITNNDGTLTAQVSANPEAGFSVVTFTDDGIAGKTIGHGLGKTPSIVIQKPLGAGNWYALYDLVDGSYDYMLLNTSGARLNSTIAPPTDTVFSNLQITGNSLAYCFADVEGYSQIGSYTGNGSINGTFVYTGFKPKMVIIKNASAAFDWVTLDTERNPENLMYDVLYPSLSNAETDATTFASFDAVSNGFKLRNTHQYTNYNGQNYIYMAFAEQPFKNANAR